MPRFEDVYSISGVGVSINKFLTIREDTQLDMTSKEIRTIHRDSVYPFYTHYNVDELYDELGSGTAVKGYLKKVSLFAKTIHMGKNEGMVKIASIRTLPNLEEMTFAVPMIVDATLRMIHPHTHRIWAELAMLVQSLQEFPNKLRRLYIVPGIVRAVRVNINDFDEYLEEEVLCDMTEGSHLHTMRRMGMPVLFSNFLPIRQGFCVLEELKVPHRLLSLTAKNTLERDISLIDWDFLKSGVFSMIIDLFTP